MRAHRFVLIVSLALALPAAATAVSFGTEKVVEAVKAALPKARTKWGTMFFIS